MYRASTPTYVRAYRCSYVFSTYVRACVRTYVRAYVGAYVGTYTHTYVPTHVRTYVRTHTRLFCCGGRQAPTNAVRTYGRTHGRTFALFRYCTGVPDPGPRKLQNWAFDPRPRTLQNRALKRATSPQQRLALFHLHLIHEHLERERPTVLGNGGL